MSIPALLLAFLCASVYGIAFFLVLGKGWIDLAIYWVTALAGFALGELVSRMLHLSLLPIGSVSVIEASVMSILCLVLVRIIVRRQPIPTSRR